MNSIISKLSKNFNFLEKDFFNFIPNRVEIINFIADAEKLDDPSKNIENIAKALECILNAFEKKYNLNLGFDSVEINLFEKIMKLSDMKRINSSHLFSLMHKIRSDRNYSSHFHTDDLKRNFEISDACENLKNLFYIITFLFKDIIPHDNDKHFDISPYGLKINNKINAIDEEQRINDNQPYKNVVESLKIDSDTIKSWLSIRNAILLVPIYQRKYEWTEENINVLFDDILKRMEDNEEHYFGTIAQKKKIGSLNNDVFDQIKIIDGQQRITTSLLFVCAARQIVIERGYEKSTKDIGWYNEIIQNHYLDKLGDYIKNPGGDTDNNYYFMQILNNEEAKTFDELKMSSSNNYVKNYKVIYQRMKNELNNKEEFYRFINTFLYKFKVASISFDNEKFSNKREMEIFENLNSKGLELKVVDLIKNHIFNFCNDELLDKYEKQIPLEYEIIISKNNLNSNGDYGELQGFYSTWTEFIYGTELKKDKRAHFNAVKNALNKTFSDFQNVSNFETYKKLIDTLNIYMQLYVESLEGHGKFLKFINCEKVINFIHDKDKRRLFAYFVFIIFNLIQVKYSNKFDFNNINFELTKEDKSAIQDLFLEITKFIIKTQVIRKQGDSSIKRLMMRIAYDNSSMETYESKSIKAICFNIKEDIHKYTSLHYTYEDFKSNLENSNDSKRVMDLLNLTEGIMTNSIFENTSNLINNWKPKIIDSILPKKDLSKWVEGMLPDEKKEFEDKAIFYKEKIGNFLLLNSKSKDQNASFKNKQAKMYKDLLSPLYKNDDVDIDVSKKSKWSFEDIDNRSKALVKYILENVISK